MLIGVYWHCHGRDKVFIRKLRYSEILVSCVWRISLVDYVFNFALAFFVFILFIMRYSLPFPCLPFLPFYRILHFTSWTRMYVRFPKVKLKQQKLQNLSRFVRRYFHPESFPLYLGTFLFLFSQRHAIQESPHSDLVLWPVCSAHRRITLVFFSLLYKGRKRKKKKVSPPSGIRLSGRLRRRLVSTVRSKETAYTHTFSSFQNVLMKAPPGEGSVIDTAHFRFCNQPQWRFAYYFPHPPRVIYE